MTSAPTATSFALLGLLGVQPWTAYELVAQARRSLHYFWPRSEAHLYAELKRLVERGHADAELVEGRRRQRTRYTITTAGRAALAEWFGTEPAPPTLEVEGMLRLFLGDQSSVQDIRAALQTIAQQARAARDEGAALIEGLLATGGPFPQRLHLTEPVVSFYGEFLFLLISWCDEISAEVGSWPDSLDIGLTPQGRERLQRLLSRERR